MTAYREWAPLAPLAGVARLWRTDTSESAGWEVLVVHDLPHALPVSTPSRSLRADQRRGDGLWVAGDHVDTPSLQGAMVSGRRVANAVTRALRGTGHYRVTR